MQQHRGKAGEGLTLAGADGGVAGQGEQETQQQTGVVGKAGGILGRKGGICTGCSAVGTGKEVMLGDEAGGNGLGATGKSMDFILKAMWHRRIPIQQGNNEI